MFQSLFKLGTMLKMKKFELEIIADPDIFIFFEKDTRGGISYTSNRYSKANKKYLKSFDPEQESKIYYILRCDLFI